MRILAIDPGNKQSAWIIFDNGVIVGHAIIDNDEMLGRAQWGITTDLLAVEMVESFGMPVGREVFETVLWVGRFIQAWEPKPWRLVYRKDVKMHLCGSMRAKDPNIRQALIDRLGPQGVKKTPGPTYGIKSHEWSALAVAVYAMDKNQIALPA